MTVTLSLYKRKKPIPHVKIERKEQLAELLRKYDKILVVDFNEVPATLIKRARLAIKDKGISLVIKNKIAQKAVEEVAKEKPVVAKLKDYLTGMRMLIFTNDDPIEIARILDTFRENIPPKPGKRAPFNIIVPKGGTGLRPGPAMTDLRVAGLPVRIIEGELFIMQDTVLVKKGQQITSQMVKVMQILDISPFEAKLNTVAALDGDVIIPGELLLKPLSEYEEMVATAISSARNIAINAVIPVVEVINEIVAKAFNEALNVATEAAILVPDNAEYMISRAFNVGIALLQEIAKENAEAIPDDLKNLLEGVKQLEAKEEAKEEKEEEKKEEKHEEEKEEEEEALGGLASLFG